MICKKTLTYNKSQDLLSFLETMRLPEEPASTEVVPPRVEEKKKDEDLTSEIDRLNNPSFYPANTPYLIYDDNKETIISRTAKGINDGVLNPYEVNWMEVILYDSMFVRQLLEKINSAFIMDVAQAINDEESRHALEDGQFTTVSSDSYGTGQGIDFYYSHTINNWDNNDSISSVSIAEGILDQRNKAEEYRKKIEQQKGKDFDNNVKSSSPRTERDDESSTDDQFTFKINQLQQERDEWKKKYEEVLEKEPEQAFNAQTGGSCLTSTQMGILMEGVALLTEEPVPGKTTLGEIVESISGYKATTVNQNLKGAHRDADKEAVVKAIESKFPNLAAKIRKL